MRLQADYYGAAWHDFAVDGHLWCVVRQRCKATLPAVSCRHYCNRWPAAMRSCSPPSPGNVAPAGKGLDSNFRTICTWMSRDGGLTWHDVAPDAYLYVTIDGSGILAMVLHPNEAPATELWISTDVG